MIRSLRLRDYHPLWPAFPDRSAYPLTTTGLFHFRSPLLAESLLMSIPPGTEMFQFPGFASPAYVFSWRYPKGVGCPIRISTDQSLLAAPHGFSQRATSFIASWCQGIHRMPLSRSIRVNEPQAVRWMSTIHRNHRRTGRRHRLRAAENALRYSSFIALLSTYTHASDHYRHTGVDNPGCSRTPIPSGQTNDPAPRRTNPAAIQPGTKMPDESHPSCPTRPETHQNQIHSNKRTNTIRPRPVATPDDKTARLGTPRSRGQPSSDRSRNHPMNSHQSSVTGRQTNSLDDLCQRRPIWRLSDSNR